MLGVVDAAQAIADLTEISPQVQRVVVIAADGSLVGSNADPAAAEKLVDGARGCSTLPRSSGQACRSSRPRRSPAVSSSFATATA